MTTPFRAPSFLSPFLQVALALTSCAALATAALTSVVGSTDAEVDAFVAQGDWAALVALLFGLVAVGQALGFVACVVAFPMFMYRAATNLRALRDTVLATTPNMAAGGWFIPFANLVIPYRALVELDQASLPSDEHRASGLIGVYWGCWIAANALSRIGEQVPSVDIVGAVLLAVAGVLAILIIRRIDANQRRLATRGETTDLAEVFV
jgi:hypothetical protein